MKTINIIPEVERKLSKHGGCFRAPTFALIYIYNTFGEEGIEYIVEERNSNIDEAFIWDEQSEGMYFWCWILGSAPKDGNVKDYFNIPEFENSNCPIHKLYWSILNTPRSISEKYTEVFKKLLHKYGKDITFEDLCIYRNYGSTREFKCPCCGKLI